MLLVGSCAINLQIPGFRKSPADEDWIVWPKEVERLSRGADEELTAGPGHRAFRIRGVINDFEVVEPGSTGEELLHWFDDTSLPLDVLYTLKLSHRYLRNSPHFLKTMLDIQKLRAAGAKVWDRGWLKRRERETYRYAHPSLNRSKQDFFTGDQVEYRYDHDSIHRAVAIGPVPAYQLFSVDGQEVLSSNEKFWTLADQERLNAVLEESYVLALERSQIPFRGQVSPIDSFRMALEKVCTSITSGWFREYAWEHYFEALLGYQGDYLGKFDQGVANGTVKPHMNPHEWSRTTVIDL